MDPDPLAIGNPVYEIQLYIIPSFGLDFIPLAHEFMLHAQRGYQVDKIIKWDVYQVLVVYIGWAADEPMQEA